MEGRRLSITKPDAARRSSKMHCNPDFKGGDILAINTKAHAAFQVLFDICKATAPLGTPNPIGEPDLCTPPGCSGIIATT